MGPVIIRVLRLLIILSMFSLSACFEEEYAGGPRGGYAPGYGYAEPGYGYAYQSPWYAPNYENLWYGRSYESPRQEHEEEEHEHARHGHEDQD
jgi:hypothetical protein